jgi:hypothetical protein
MGKPVTSKQCSRCGRMRSVSQYRVIHNRKTGRSRLHSWCIPCQRTYMAKKWEANDSPVRRERERERVKAYQQDPSVAARRAARSGAQYRALAALRLRYLDEYEKLRTRLGTSSYPALAALRETHRDEYQQLYDEQLRVARLDLA